MFWLVGNLTSLRINTPWAELNPVSKMHLWECESPVSVESCPGNLVTRSFPRPDGSLLGAQFAIYCREIGVRWSETLPKKQLLFFFFTHVASSNCQGPENISCSCVSPCGSWIAYSTASRFFLYRVKYERGNISLQRVSEDKVDSCKRVNFLNVYFCLKWKWIR